MHFKFHYARWSLSPPLLLNHGSPLRPNASDDTLAGIYTAPCQIPRFEPHFREYKCSHARAYQKTILAENQLQPQLNIHYKEDQARNGLAVLLALSPVWGLWSIYVSSWLLAALLRAGISGYEDLLALLLFYISLICVGLFGLFVCLDAKFVVNEKELRLPWRYFLNLGFTRTQKWSDLQTVDFKDDELILRFKMGEARFNLNGMNNNDLKDFVVAVRSNAPEARCSFDKKAIETVMPDSQAAPSADGSFTAVWEQDLASRFGSTAFVPLEARAKLKNDTLTVIGQVSFGGLSAVYLCKDKLGDSVIVKEAVVPLNSDMAMKEKAIEMFQREAKILQGLNHPYIARVLDHFVENDRHYLMLEHVNGVDLRAFVKEHGQQGERLIMRWALDMALILSYLHSKDPPIIHRDITPDNIVLDRLGSIKLIDFGAANELLGTATGTLVGKQCYIPPEQFRGKATTQSDIYALGCTLYYLTTGTDPEPLSQSSLPDDLKEKYPALNELIEKCTAMETESRLQTAEDVVALARAYTKGYQQESLSLSTVEKIAGRLGENL